MSRSFLLAASLPMPTKGLKLFTKNGKKMVVRRILVWCCAVSLLGSSLGCSGGSRRSAQHTEVSGTVTYNGKPVTGGQIKFVGDDWAAIEGVIDETGHYTINAPVGTVKITVDNRMVQAGAIREQASQGAGPRPGGPPPKPIKGKYVQIPEKYYDPARCGLSYTVQKGPQTHDVVLTD